MSTRRTKYLRKVARRKAKGKFIHINLNILPRYTPDDFLGAIEIRPRQSGRSYKLPHRAERIKSSELSGKPLNRSAMQHLMDILNGGPEMPYISPDERWRVSRPESKRMGRIFLAGTGEEK